MPFCVENQNEQKKTVFQLNYVRKQVLKCMLVINHNAKFQLVPSLQIPKSRQVQKQLIHYKTYNTSYLPKI